MSSNITPEIRTRIVELWKDGHTLDSIGRAVRVHILEVCRELDAAGVPCWPLYSKDEREVAVVTEYLAGLAAARIAQRHNMTRETVHRIVSRRGVDRRSVPTKFDGDRILAVPTKMREALKFYAGGGGDDGGERARAVLDSIAAS